MIHLPELIKDLGLILMAAGVVTLLFRKLHQPVVLGYIVSGFLVGPHFPYAPTIGDKQSIDVWAEIGVIFLLFALGLEFSFKKLVKEGRAASITAVVEVFGMGLIGYATGRFFGWSNIDSIFLGGILSISSTTIIIRAFEETGVKGRGFVGLVFGVLIVEDLIAILMLGLLSTIATTKTFEAMEIVNSSMKLVFFIALWFLTGVFVLPTVFKKFKKHFADETMLIVSLGLCFAMVIFTTKVGFSPALGAFIMGSLLAETPEGEHISKLLKPVRNLFAAVFFVSVGMLIDPKIIANYWAPILIITGITIFGKALSTAVGALLAGRHLRHAVQSGMSLAQIGEFSFIIAGLGLSLKATSEFLYPIAVGVSAITTFTTPYLILSSDFVFSKIEKILPAGIKTLLLEKRSDGVSDRKRKFSPMRSNFVKFGANAVLVSAIFISLQKWLSPFIKHWDLSEENKAVALIVCSIGLSAPFLWAMVKGEVQIKNDLSEKKQKAFTATIETARWITMTALLFGLITVLATVKLAVWTTIALAFLFLFVFSKHLEKIYSFFEGHFIHNLSANDNAKRMPKIAPWDAHITSLEIRPTSPVVGKTLESLKIRERFGVSIAMMRRGDIRIPAPTRNEFLFPYDRVYVIGTDDQILKFKTEIDQEVEIQNPDDFDFGLSSYLVATDSPFVGKTIRQSGIREKSLGLVVGIERAHARTLNPDSLMIIEPGDLLWIVGPKNYNLE